MADEKNSNNKNTSSPLEEQSNMVAIIAVIILLIAAIGLIWYLAGDELDIDDAEQGGGDITDVDFQNPTVDELLADNPETFGTFNDALNVSESQVDLSDPESEYTVFAPTDSAFEEMPESEREQLFGDPEALSQVVELHIVEGLYTSEDLTTLDGQTLDTLQGGEVSVTAGASGAVVLNDTATTIDADMEASNGIVHSIDRVLSLPSE